MKARTLKLFTAMIAYLLINACSGTSPSIVEAKCGDLTAEGEVFLTDNAYSCLKSLNKKNAAVCGARIATDEVLVIDMESSDPEHKSPLEEVGPYVLVTDKPIAIPSSGSQIQTTLRARRLAANSGCDLLLLGPTQTGQRIGGENPAITNSSGSTQVVRYVFVKLGHRQD